MDLTALGSLLLELRLVGFVLCFRLLVLFAGIVLAMAGCGVGSLT